MKFSEVLINRLARYLGVNVSDVKPSVLKSAMYAVEKRNECFFDAMCNHGQMADNVPYTVALALTYSWLCGGKLL